MDKEKLLCDFRYVNAEYETARPATLYPLRFEPIYQYRLWGDAHYE
jgi:hypothetical protein